MKQASTRLIFTPILLAILINGMLVTSAHAEPLRIQDSKGVDLVVFYDDGDINIQFGYLFAGSAANLKPRDDVYEFTVEDSQGKVILRVDSKYGDLHLAGGFQHKLPALPSISSRAFRIKDENDVTVAIVDGSGFLYTTGTVRLGGFPIDDAEQNETARHAPGDLPVGRINLPQEVPASSTDLPIQPDLPLQEQLEQMLAALAAEDDAAFRTVHDELVSRYQNAQTSDRVHLLQQITLFAYDSRTQGQGILRWTVGGILADECAFTDEEFIFSVWPYLKTTDPYLKKFLGRTVAAAEGPQPRERSDYTSYIDFLRKHTRVIDDDTMVLVKHLFDGDALEALRVMIHVYGNPNIDLPIHESASEVVEEYTGRYYLIDLIPDKPVEALRTMVETMARHEAWWARYFAATVLKRVPELDTSDVIERLRADADPYVADRAQRIRRRTD